VVSIVERHAHWALRILKGRVNDSANLVAQLAQRMEQEGIDVPEF